MQPISLFKLFLLYKSFWEEELTRIGALKDVTASSNRIENKFCIVLPKCNKCLFA